VQLFYNTLKRRCNKQAHQLNLYSPTGSS
jgi:hypothetical protein